MKIKNKISAKLLGTAVLSTVLLFSNCKKDEDFSPDVSPASSTAELKDDLGEKAITMAQMPSDFYNIANALPEGYVKDASVDYTSYVQAAINKYSKIAFPDFPILINDSGLKIPSNRFLSFVVGAELRLKPSSKEKYDIIRIENAYNVTIAHANIVGDRNTHKGTAGEWGNGIGVYGSTKVNISHAKVINCWGDGIYIGKSSRGISKNIRLFKPYCKSNRRDGISVTGVDGLQMLYPYAGYSNGTSPYCGINIEPNSSIDEIKNVEITNPVTEYNKGNGIQIGLTRMYNGSTKNIDVTITNHIDEHSGVYAFKISNYKQDGYLKGSINIVDPKWKYFADRPLWMQQTDPYIKTTISNPTVTSLPGSYVGTLSSTYYMLKFGLKKVSEPFVLQ